MDSNYLFVATLADTILINRNLYGTEIIGMGGMLNKIMTPVVNRSRLHKCISSESFCMKIHIQFVCSWWRTSFIALSSQDSSVQHLWFETHELFLVPSPSDEHT